MTALPHTRILLIEDDVALASLIDEFLQEQGAQVTTVHNGAEAIRTGQRHQYDLIICDVMLPDLHGFQLAQRLRLHQSCPLIFLTALGDDDTHLQGLELGAADFITKPVKPAILLARIKNNLNKHAVKASVTSLAFGPYQLNERSKTVTRHSEPVNLTNQEFDLLHFFVRYCDGPVSREFLFLQIVGRPYDGSDRAADLQVSRLRRKLISCGCDDLAIKTIRGKGYVLLLDSDNALGDDE
ncbi:response regulator transcription factor [Aestuariibacter salexigens]|uniref:response regulator transcription factor n=1 Tax=Aestuariibacter salexigens TaxID=226010 RepID=UPI00041F50D3|nr:response regulator transcription factor [Aestuariibacter salexigens]